MATQLISNVFELSRAAVSLNIECSAEWYIIDDERNIQWYMCDLPTVEYYVHKKELTSGTFSFTGMFNATKT